MYHLYIKLEYTTIMYDITFIQPSTFLMVGGTGSGKTTLCSKIVANKKILFDRPPKYTILCYSQMQPLYTEMYNRGDLDLLIEGYPSFEKITELVKPYKSEGSILIFDDGLTGMAKDNSMAKDITRIFYELSSHQNVSTFFLCQNLFYANKEFRTLSLNSKYIFIFKNPVSFGKKNLKNNYKSFIF